MSKNELWPRLILLGFLTLLTARDQNTEAFNVDTKYPTVFHGPPNSYFGYSVTFGLNEKQNYWLLVGAPKANQSRVPALMQPGAIYQCRFNEAKLCTEVTLDLEGNTAGSNYGEEYHSQKDGGWLGVSLDTNHDGSLLVACAHRWENQLNYQKWRKVPRTSSYVPLMFSNGMCYTMTPDLQLRNVKTYMPPLSSMDQVLRSGVPNYAFGMAGTTAHFSKTPGELILGAPGVYNWQGNVISVLLDNQFHRLPKTSVWGPTAIGGNMGRFVYFGYSVSSGTFLSTDATSFNVIGAPRQNYTGYVFLVTKLTKNTQIIYRWKGKQMGEYFGAAVCATDLNGDGLADVIIGAPFYSDPHQIDRDHGKVYISLNQDKYKFGEPFELLGSNTPNARFGSAIGCLGDLDMDNNQDIAVGAPYEDDGAGAIYIYYGDKYKGIADNLVQKILAKEVDRKLRGFGVSFAKSLDVDRNSVADLGIGSYVSDHAVILRTRRVIMPNTELTRTQNVDLHTCYYLNTKVRCFNISVCLSYSTESPSIPSLAFEFELRVDVNHKSEAARGNIVHGYELKPSVSGMMQVNKRRNCQDFEIYLRNDIKHYTPPFFVSLKSSLGRCTSQQPSQYFESCPVVHPHSSMQVLLEVSLLTECKNGKMCESDLQLQASIVFQNNGVVNPTVKLGVNKTVTINTTIANNGENAYLTELNITFLRKLSLHTPPVTCIERGFNGQYRYIICDIGKPLTNADSFSMPLTINVENMSWIDKELVIILTVKTDSNDKNLKNNQVDFRIPVVTEATIYVAGTPSDQYISYAHYSEREARSINFTHCYQIINLGKATLAQVQVTIQVPQRSGDSVYLRNAIVHTKDGNKGARVTECRTASTRYREDPGEARDTIETPDPARKRRKREANQSPPPQRGIALFCSNSVECLTIECDVATMNADDQVEISIDLEVDYKELDNLMFKQEFVDFTTRASVHISSLQSHTQSFGLKPDFTKVATSLASGYSNTERLADWVIPVSITAGFLLLLLITLILRKVGFFRRTVRDSMKKMQEEENRSHRLTGCSKNSLTEEQCAQEVSVQQQSE